MAPKKNKGKKPAEQAMKLAKMVTIRSKGLGRLASGSVSVPATPRGSTTAEQSLDNDEQDEPVLDKAELDNTDPA